jgi:hypothetical protein
MEAPSERLTYCADPSWCLPPKPLHSERQPHHRPHHPSDSRYTTISRKQTTSGGIPLTDSIWQGKQIRIHSYYSPLNKLELWHDEEVVTEFWSCHRLLTHTSTMNESPHSISISSSCLVSYFPFSGRNYNSDYGFGCPTYCCRSFALPSLCRWW